MLGGCLVRRRKGGRDGRVREMLSEDVLMYVGGDRDAMALSSWAVRG